MKCNGTKANEMPDGCIVVVNSKITFSDYEDDEAVFKKMETLRRIENGVEVVGTTLEIFEYLSSVDEIRNPDGPAIVFRNNQLLKRITMTQLKSLSGKEEDVLFDKDNFPIEAFENSGALEDMLALEAASRSAHGEREECSDEFIKIIPIPAPGYGWLLYTLIALCAIMTPFVGYQTYRFFRSKQKSKVSYFSIFQKAFLSINSNDAIENEKKKKKKKQLGMKEKKKHLLCPFV
uniref:Recep_L_domain domain-containing protein n=1 Tax=Caenorhabditis tropicalis TaxID=1561998 RepID=A0A1I7U899_9PELO